MMPPARMPGQWGMMRLRSRGKLLSDGMAHHRSGAQGHGLNADKGKKHAAQRS
jgi:hypothetical protein